jgi:hypothetical protein
MAIAGRDSVTRALWLLSLILMAACPGARPAFAQEKDEPLYGDAPEGDDWRRQLPPADAQERPRGDAVPSLSPRPAAQPATVAEVDRRSESLYERGQRMKTAGIVLSMLGVTHFATGATFTIWGLVSRDGGGPQGLLLGIGTGVLGASVLYGVPGAILWTLGQRRMDAHRGSRYEGVELLRQAGRIERGIGIALVGLGAVLATTGAIVQGYNGYLLYTAIGPPITTIGIPLWVDGHLRVREASRFVPLRLSLVSAPVGSSGASLRLEF